MENITKVFDLFGLNSLKVNVSLVTVYQSKKEDVVDLKECL